MKNISREELNCQVEVKPFQRTIDIMEGNKLELTVYSLVGNFEQCSLTMVYVNNKNQRFSICHEKPFESFVSMQSFIDYIYQLMEASTMNDLYEGVLIQTGRNSFRKRGSSDRKPVWITGKRKYNLVDRWQ